MSKKISLEELKKHNTEESVWIAIHGNVYDVTEFVKEHPGGPKPLELHGGLDASEGFDHINHSESAKEWKESFLVGKLEGAGGGGCCGFTGMFANRWTALFIGIGVPLAILLAMKYMASKSH